MIIDEGEKNMENGLLRIKEILIEGLFGTFTYKIPLNFDDHLTIIHGPNGFGKTTLLRLIHDLFSGDYTYLLKTRFNKMKIHFEDYSIYLEKSKGGQKEDSLLSIFDGTNPENVPINIPLGGMDTLSLYRTIRRYKSQPRFSKIQSRIIRNLLMHGDYANFKKYIDDNFSFEERDNILRIFNHLAYKIPKENWFYRNIRRKIQVEFLETDRLFTFITPKEIKETIFRFSENLVSQIQEARNKYNDLTTTIDRSFPTRIFGTERSFPPDEEIMDLLNDIEMRRYELDDVGLIDQEEDSDILQEFQAFLSSSKEYHKSILMIYIDDIEKKLDVFTPIYEKISLFRRIIANRLGNKKLFINKEKGFIIKTLAGETLNLQELSSGEKHTIVMFYQLIFMTEPGVLVLIDEPEISLHVDWQEEYLNDVLAVTKLNNLDILIATHSPAIIGDRWDLTVSLEGVEAE